MGLGKTRTAIVAAREEAPDGPFLVICPASVKLNWRREIQLVEPGADVQVARRRIVAVRARAPLDGRQLRPRVPPPRGARRRSEWAVIVVDEAHYIKNDSVRSRRTLELLGVAGKRRRPAGPAPPTC